MNLGLFLLIIFILAANVIIGYVIAILLGIGPSDFRTAWAFVKPSQCVAGILRSIQNLHIPEPRGLVDYLASFVGWFKTGGNRTQNASELAGDSGDAIVPEDRGQNIR